MFPLALRHSLRRDVRTRFLVFCNCGARCCYFAFLVQLQLLPVQSHDPQRSFEPRSKQSGPPLQLHFFSSQLK
jgi:hypothetical protein